MAGTLTIVGMSAGEPAGERIFGPLSIQGGAVIGETFVQNLKEGDNTFAVPVGAVAAVLIPPVNNEVALRLRTNKNIEDEGLPLSPNAIPTVYPFIGLNPSSLIVWAQAPTSKGMTVFYI